MRLVFFFVLSLALHVAALVCPVSFGWRSQVDPIQVTILPIEQEEGGAAGEGGNGKPAGRSDSKSHRSAPPAVEPRFESNTISNPEPQALPAETVAKVSDSSMELVPAKAGSAETVGSAISGPAGNDANGSSRGGTGSGNGFGSSSSGFGRGSDNGNGSGSSGAGIALMQARYRETPKPIYPENARREGREGRVVLRVLIDTQGKTKSIELNTSSGSKALDQAATEAIKQWRFHPAHEGDIPVDSWVNVPIDFRLTDARN